MKFYNINNDALNYYPMEIYEAEDGEWATRADAEQAAKDAVEMALLAQRKIYELYDGKSAHMDDPSYIEAQAIIERYEGGKG